jgi:hypothetical protein
MGLAPERCIMHQHDARFSGNDISLIEMIRKVEGDANQRLLADIFFSPFSEEWYLCQGYVQTHTGWM